MSNTLGSLDTSDISDTLANSIIVVLSCYVCGKIIRFLYKKYTRHLELRAFQKEMWKLEHGVQADDTYEDDDTCEDDEDDEDQNEDDDDKDQNNTCKDEDDKDQDNTCNDKGKDEDDKYQDNTCNDKDQDNNDTCKDENILPKNDS